MVGIIPNKASQQEEDTHRTAWRPSYFSTFVMEMAWTLWEARGGLFPQLERVEAQGPGFFAVE